MKKVLCLLWLSASFAFADSVQDIVQKHDRAKADALEAYLKANASAPDRNAAIELLVQTRMELDDTAGLRPYLDEQYAALDKKKAETARDVYFNTMLLSQIILKEQGKEAAIAHVEKVLKDVEGNPEEGRLAQAIESIMGEFNQPQVGDVLEISSMDINGKKVDLASMKGKVVLVDFWATWCGPCIHELPTVKEAYKKYHEQGFDIIAISLDNDKGELERFIKDQELPWHQLFDGKGWKTDLVAKYGITGIPATFLVGKDGKIVDRDLRGPALHTAVESALKN